MLDAKKKTFSDTLAYLWGGSKTATATEEAVVGNLKVRRCGCCVCCSVY